jgi:2-haloacid dehalogenase
MDLARNGLTRRQLGGLMLTVPFAMASGRAMAAAQVMPKALFYDVFGTVMDWRRGVARESERILGARGYKLEWLKFADAWRALYQPSMEEVRSGRRPFVKLDVLHREMLEKIRPQFGLKDLPEEALADLNLAWHRLDAWPDVKEGFARLGRRFLMAPCSNGNIALMANVARRNNIPWDAILGSEIAQGYKPQPKVYLMTCEAFNLKPEQVMMCAAHSGDLSSAQQLGLRTGHIGRPGEGGPGTGETEPKGSFDVVGKNFHDFADKLGV